MAEIAVEFSSISTQQVNVIFFKPRLNTRVRIMVLHLLSGTSIAISIIVLLHLFGYIKKDGLWNGDFQVFVRTSPVFHCLCFTPCFHYFLILFFLFQYHWFIIVPGNVSCQNGCRWLTEKHWCRSDKIIN